MIHQHEQRDDRARQRQHRHELDDVRVLVPVRRYRFSVEEATEEMIDQGFESFIHGATLSKALTDGFSDIPGHGFHIFVLDQLGENLFE